MNRRHIVVYVAGKYTGENYDEIDSHIRLARDYAVKIWELGFTAICPHLNTAHFEVFASKVAEQEILAGYLSVIKRCDALFLLPDWRDSKGATRELHYAREHDIPVFMRLEKLDAAFRHS